MRWLSVDPGETVGWALWEDGQLLDQGQTPDWTFVDDVADSLKVSAGEDAHRPQPFGSPKLIVVEEFSLYPWKLRDGSMDFDTVETARVIGGIFMLTRLAEIRFELQGADIKESAVAGGAEELFLRPLHENRHANDATMHGVHYWNRVIAEKVQAGDPWALGQVAAGTVTRARS